MDRHSLNEQIILAVFTADDQAKARALDILQNKEVRPSLSGPLLLGMGEPVNIGFFVDFCGFSSSTGVAPLHLTNGKESGPIVGSLLGNLFLWNRFPP